MSRLGKQFLYLNPFDDRVFIYGRVRGLVCVENPWRFAQFIVPQVRQNRYVIRAPIMRGGGKGEDQLVAPSPAVKPSFVT